MPLRDRLLRALGGDALERLFDDRLRREFASVPAARDDAYWHNLTAPDPLTRPWFRQRDLLEKTRRACATNPLAARIVGMTTDFVVGAGARVQGDPWALAFWHHPQNAMGQRVYRWCDELTRAGELFVVLSLNPVDRMSYVREVPAHLIDDVISDPEDVERERLYHQLTGDADGAWWPAAEAVERGVLPRTVDVEEVFPQGLPEGAIAGAVDDLPQVMLHHAINRPVGEQRGASDLAPILTWLERYDLWLEDRVRINRYKGAYLWHVQVQGAMPGQLEAKRAQYSRPPTSGSIVVSDGGETWTAVRPNIGADDVEADGKAIRLMIAAGAGIPLHFLAEGESATRATAREMGTATFRHFSHRQRVLGDICERTVRAAARRAGHEEIDVRVTFDPVMAEVPGGA